MLSKRVSFKQKREHNSARKTEEAETGSLLFTDSSVEDTGVAEAVGVGDGVVNAKRFDDAKGAGVGNAAVNDKRGRRCRRRWSW